MKIGTCFNCNEKINKENILNHLKQCISTENNECFIIAESENYFDDYWIVLVCTSNITLNCIDFFLRTTWVECCGHMSSFNEKKNKNLYELHKNKKSILYEYDMGTTTTISLKIKANKLQLNNKSDLIIKLVAQNDKPKLKCDKCDKKLATIVLYDNKYCKTCLKYVDEYKQDEIDSLILPLVNSPRTGLCGYDGNNLKKNKIYFEKYDFNILIEQSDSDDDIYNIPIYNLSHEIRGNCSVCNKNYTDKYMATHLKKKCADDKMIVKLIYENNIPEYEHDIVWMYLECPNIKLSELLIFLNKQNIYNQNIKIDYTQNKKIINENTKLINCDEHFILYLDTEIDYILPYIEVKIYNKDKYVNCNDIKILAKNDIDIKRSESIIKPFIYTDLNSEEYDIDKYDILGLDILNNIIVNN